MNLETKTDILKSLADSHRSQFDQRRTYEWRIIFAALAFYVGTTAAVLAKDISLPITWYTITGYIVLAIATSGYLAYIHMANNMNKSIAENAEDAMISMLKDESISIENLNCFDKHWVSWKSIISAKRASRWGWIWQTLTLFLFAAVSLLLISKVQV